MIKVTWPYMFCNTPQTITINSNKEYSVYRVNSGNIPADLIYSGISASVGGKPDISPIVQNYIKAPDYAKWLVWNTDDDLLVSSDADVYNFKATPKGQSTATIFSYTWGYPPTSRTEIEQEFGNVQDYYIATLPFVVYGPYYKIAYVTQNGIWGDTVSTTSRVSVARAWLFDLEQVTVQRFQSNAQTPDDTITLSKLPCSEGFTHCLYFLKLDGSVGWVFVKDKTGGKLNVTRDNYSTINLSTTQAPNRLIQQTYRVGYYRTRSFNTGFLTSDQARKLQQLFISPRVWMMDLEGNLLGEVFVTDKSFEVKDRRVWESPVSYTINVREVDDYSLVSR